VIRLPIDRCGAPVWKLCTIGLMRKTKSSITIHKIPNNGYGNEPGRSCLLIISKIKKIETITKLMNADTLRFANIVFI